MNVVVLQGTLSREPQERLMPSGDVVVEYEVRVKLDDGRAETVPVVWHEAPPTAAAQAAGTEVVVTGRVRRRFFRSGGATQSRTEVVAAAVIARRSRRRASKAVQGAVEAIMASADE